MGGSDADGVKFAIDVKPGKSYKIAAKPTPKTTLIPGKRFDVFVINEQDIQCEGEAKDPLPTENYNPEILLVSE